MFVYCKLYFHILDLIAMLTNITITYICSQAGSQRRQNICITFVQCRPNVEDVEPTLYKCYTNVLCLLGN